MGYIISAKGELCEAGFGRRTLRSAIQARLDSLAERIKDSKELEIDYCPEEDVWVAMEYNEENESACELEINGNIIIAFLGSSHEHGIKHKDVADALSSTDIFYVA